MSSRTSLGVVLLALLLAGGGAYYFLRGRTPSPADTIPVVVAGIRLVVPQGYLRASGASLPGMVDRLDLAATYPDFRQAGHAGPAAIATGADSLPENIVFVSLAAKDAQIEPQDRPARLYARFLESDEWTHAGGLVMRRFQDHTPFEKEDLYMTPPEGRAFFARCLRPKDKPDGVPDTCISETRVGSLDVQVRFSPALLADWERVMEGARGLVQTLIR